MLKNLIAIFKTQARQIFSAREQQNFRGLYTAPPQSYADKYPDIPKPEPSRSPRLLAARWASGDLRGEDMPTIAVNLLEAGYDTPTLRRLAGEINVTRSADVEELVGKMFHEMDIYYPHTEAQARLFFTQQIAREVIAGERNAWAAAKHLEIVVWGWKAESDDLDALFLLNDEIHWDSAHRRPITTLKSELIEIFSRLGALADREKRMASLGCLQGRGWIADDFDAPLPDELLALFEGHDDPLF